MLVWIAFVLLSAIILGSGVLAITRPQPRRCLRWLVVGLVGTAGMYLLAGDVLLAGAQAIFGAGIGVMWLRPAIAALIPDPIPSERIWNPRLKLTLAVVSALAGAVAYAILRTSGPALRTGIPGVIEREAPPVIPSAGVSSLATCGLLIEVGLFLAIAVAVGIASLSRSKPE
jgi:NADH:ubiquinone oxidoreductase subunit 6 (subunit J)